MHEEIDHIADLNAERALLSCCMISPDAMADVQDSLSASDFFDARHAHVWRTLVGMTGETDPISIYSTLGADADKVGLNYLIDLAGLVGAAMAAPSYAATVSTKANVRRTLSDLHNLTAAARTSDPATWLAAVDAFTLSSAKSGKRRAESLAAVTARVWADYIADKVPVTQLTPSGLTWLDKLHGGGFAAAMHVIAAPTSGGKTSLATQVAAGIARTTGRVLFYCGEMSNNMQVQRIMAQHGANYTAIAERSRDAHNYANVNNAAALTSELDIMMSDLPINLESTIADILRNANRGKIAAVIIDYYQIIRSTRRFERSLDLLVHISIELTALARRIETPIFVLSQIKPAVAGEKRLPTYGDLADCSQLAKDAHSITFPCIHSKIFGPAADPNECTIVIAKHRNGKTGTSRSGEVRWDGAQYIFHSGGF